MDIQGYFEVIIKKHKTLTENAPVQIYPNKIKNRIVFKIKTGYKLELLPPETMKLLGSTNTDVDKDKDGEKVPKLKSVEVVLVHCNLVKNDVDNQNVCCSKQTTWTVNKYFTAFFNNEEQLILNFLLLRFRLQTKLVMHLRLKIISI